MRYTTWVSDVFTALVRIAPSRFGSVGLAALGHEIGFAGLTGDDFGRDDGVTRAILTALYDLAALDLVEVDNVGTGNRVSDSGRDVAASGGLPSLWPAIGDIHITEVERAFLTRLYVASSITGDGWADLRFADAEPIHRDLGLEASGEHETRIERMTFLGDLERKGLVRAESVAIGASDSYRPTYVSAVLAAETDARDRGIEAGLLDWSVPTPGFEAIADRLAELKIRLADARSDGDLSDIGLRCRDIAADAVDVVFRPDMVPAGERAPSRQDAEERLRLYLRARAGGKANEDLRSFVRAALGLAHARTHSARTGRAAAVASAQGLLSFVRSLEAMERFPVVPDLGDDSTDDQAMDAP